jgi:hypothetical protein
MPKFTTIIAGDQVLVSDRLQGFKLFKKNSTMVSYLGVSDTEIFAQFAKGGAGLIYKGKDDEVIPPEVIEAAVNAPSIGGFIHAELKGKYDTEATETNAIELAEDLDGEEFGDDYLPI